MTPWFQLAVMSLTAYRLTRLLVKDTLPPVLWLRDRLAGGWRKFTLEEYRSILLPVDWDGHTITTVRGLVMRNDEGDSLLWINKQAWSPYWLAELITCPWCASAYISGCVVGVTDLTAGVRWPWAMAGAVWALAALLASREWA